MPESEALQSATGPARFQVVGNPITHSLSPQIHRAFAQQFKHHIEYEKVLIPSGQFDAYAQAFLAAGGQGWNITVPYKREAFDFVDVCDDLATAAGAVNTIHFDGDYRRGYNTDGIGLVRDLTQRHGVSLAGAQILLLGAGGATRGVLLPLLQAKPQQIVVANRTFETAQRLVAEISQYIGDRAKGSAIASIELVAAPLPVDRSSSVDIVVNATSLAQQNAAANIDDWFGDISLNGAFCYDMSYGANAKFAAWARARGLVAQDGLGMLVEQAAESYRIWHGTLPETESVYETLRQQINDQ